MPRYDFRCAAGHVHEHEASRDTRTLACLSCRLSAQREVAVTGITGMVTTPTRFAPVQQSRYLEAQGEILHAYEKVGREAPDLYAAAKARIKRGDVQAIA